MRISEIQQQLPPEEQVVPVRRAIAWSLLLVVIAAGLYLYFRYARELEPLLGTLHR
ncbi:MAG TPA: hypothetical protein VGD77_09270 [Gemmatimonadaceae bacterium]